MKTQRAYNIFSWWIIVWVFLFIINVTTINPFFGILISFGWDLYSMLAVAPTTTTHSQSFNKDMVDIFKLLLITFAHWIPLCTLPIGITVESVGLFFLLFGIYLLLLTSQKISIFDIYETKVIHVDNINYLSEFLSIRFVHPIVSIILLSIVFYNGIYLINRPYQNSLALRLRRA